MAATLWWLAAGVGAQAQDFNFTNQQSGLWSDVNVWVNGAASAPTNGGGTNYIINFVNDAADFSTNDLSAGGLTNFYLNQLNFEGAARTYLMTMGSGVSNFVFSFNNGLPQINQDTWATSVISTVSFILDTNLLVGGTGGGAPLTGSILTFSNRVSGKGKIIMSGAFTLRLAASNSYMGGTILSNGIIQLANSNALSTGSTYLIQVYGNNAALDLGGADIANATAGAGSKTVMISGMGLGPNTGIIYNSGSSMTAKGLRNVLLGSDSAIGQDGGGRFDIIGTLNGGNHTLYKVGNNQVALTTTTIITNMVSVVVNEGRFTLVGASNLVSSGRTLFQVYTSGVFGVYGTLTFTNAIDMRGGTFENNGAGVTTWNGPIALNGDSNSFSAAGGDMFIGGDITGEGQLVKVGLHALTLSGVNTYSGGLFISSGMVVFTSASALPSTPAVPITLGAAGGVGATGIYSTVMDWLNSGKFASGTGGFVAMATNNSEAIDFSVGGGYTDMFLASMDRMSFVSFTGTITPVSTNYCLGAFGNMVLPMDNVLTNLYGSSANLIVGPAGVISSTGFVMLVGSNSYGGITTVNSNHTLSIGTTANIGGDGKTLVLNGGGLQIRGTVLTNSSTMTLRLVSGGDSTLDIDNNGNTFTLTNNLTGGGDLTKLGSGTLVLAGTNGLTGRLYIQEGVVRITNSWGLAAGSNVVVSGAALELGTNIERAVTGTGGNSRRIILNGSGIDNDGALRINSNFFQGVITNYASVRLASASRINADLGITLVQAGIVSNFTRLLTFGGYGNFIVTNVVGGSGGLAKDGSGMLTVGGKYTNTWGATFVNAGILRLDYGLVSGGLNANMVTNAAVTLGSAAFSITTGGTWVVNGPAAARTSTQCFNSLTIGPGNNRLIVSNGSGNVELNVSNVFRVIGSGALDASFESGSRITSTLTNNYAGLLGFGTASTVGTNVLITINGVDWAMATNFAAGRATITPYDGYTDIQSGGTMVDGSNTNVRITDAGPGGFISLGAGVTRINSLIAADTTAVVTNDFAGQMLQMGQTAGILLTPTSGGLTLGSSANDGFLTAGGDTNTLGELILINYSDSALTVNSSIISNGMGAVTVTVAGNGSVNFMGNNAYNQTFIHGGNVVFYGTNNISGSSPLTVYQGEVTFAPGSVNSLAGGSIMVDGGGVLNINGSLALSGAGNPSFIVGYTAGSRAVATVSTNVTIGYQTHVGYNGAGALYLTNNGVMDVGDYFWLGKNAGSYGYLKLTNGTLLSGTKGGNLSLEIGDEGVGVMDVLGGAYTNVGNYFMIARSDDSVGRGVLNVLGGRVVHAGNTDLRFGWTDTAGRGAYGVINIGGGGVLDAAAGGTTTKIDLNYSTGVSATSVVNVLSGGTLIANAIGATLDGTTVLSFNGGTLQAAAGTTLGSNFVSGLSGAYIYSDGATIDSGTNNITVSVSLLAPSGYGLTNIAVADMGIGYIGAPLVMITGGSGTGATAIAQVDLDPTSPTYQQITNILITSTGSGYYSNDMLNVTLLGGGAIQAGRVGAFTFGTNSSGGGLIKNGAGALILTDDNTYDGPTVINAGYLLVNSINQPGLTSLTLTNLQTAGIGLTVAMDQSFLTWLDSKVTAPTTNIVVLGADTTSNLAFTDVNTSNMFLGGIGATYSGSATWTDPTALRLGGAPGQLTYASAIGGATNVIIGPVNGNASSTVLLGGSNSFISTIIVNSGSLAFTNDYNLGDPNNAVVLTNGGGLRIISTTAWNSTRTLNLTNGGGLITVDSGNTFYVNGSITGTGSLTKVGSGTLTMLANPIHTGGTILSNGTLSIGNGPNIGGTGASITFAGGTLQIRGVALNNLDAMAVNWEAFNGGLDINNDGNAFLVTNNINGGGALIKTGNGLLVLSGDNSGLQRLVVNGPLMITNGTALAGGSNIVLTGGSLQLASNIVTDPRLIVINGNGTGQANFSNKDGALRSVNGINTNTGPIVLASAARIRANAGSQLYLDGAITNGAYLLTFAGFGEIISRGGIYGTGGILKERAATVTLQNLVTNAYGNTAIDAGPLMFDYNAAGGTVVSNLVAPNSTLTLGASGFSLTTGGTLIVNGPSVGAMTQSFASVTINPGNNRITAVNNGGDIFLNLGNINRSVGSGILDLTLPGGAGEITSTLSNNYAGLLRLGAAGTGGTNVLITIDGTDWAMATNFGTGINKITNYVGYVDIPDGSIITNGNMNMRIIGGGPGGNITLDSAVTTINSLVVTNAAATTIDLESAKTLRLGETGGILLTPTSGGLQIGASVNDGFLTAGGADNTAGELVFINNAANALTVNSALASNGTGTLTVTVNGNGAVSFAGANNSFNRLYVNSGVVTFSGTNAVISSSPLTIRGGTVTLLATSTNWFSGGHTYINAGTLDINGPVTFGIIGGASSTTNSLVIGSATDDRGVVSVTTNVIVSGQTLIGNGSGSAGALYQGDGIYSNVSSVYIGSAAGGYGYMSLTNGRFSSAGQTRVGNAGVGVMEVLGGEALISGGVIMDRSAGGVGVLNVLGGRFAVTGSGALTFGYGDQATTYGLINVGNGGILDLATGSTTKILNLNVSTNGPGGGTGIVNVLSGGTLVVNKLGASALGTTLLNFNGGTLKASPGTTVGATFMTNGLAGAYIYSGGATINTDTNIIFIAQSLRAPVGYGLTNIALGYSGEGYIGAPAVIISGGSGSGATAIAQWDPVTGTITNILITSAGSGYLSNDVLSIALVGGGFTRPADVGTFSFGTNSTSGGLTKAGSGELHLTGTNTYKGVTVLLEGTLVIYSPDNIPVGNTIEFAGGAFSPLGTASLDDYLLSGDFAFDVPLGSVLAVNNSLTGAGSTLTKLGEGLLIVTGNNDYGSGTFISNGLIRFNSPASLPTTSMITMEAGSMVSLVTNSVNAGLVPYIGAQDFGAIGLLPTNATENSEDINFNNAGPGARVFTNLSFGAGSNLLYTGTYTPYQRDGTNFWRLAAFYGVTLTFSNTMTNYTEASILEVNKGGNGLCGTVALIGTNTYSGGTFIGGGTLSILGDFSLGAALGSPATNFTFLGNATLQFVTSMNLDANRAFSMAGGTGTFDTLANTVVIPGTIGGDGSMRKVGIGTLVLNSNTDTVQFLTVNAGTLWLSNTLFTATGVFANGSITVGDSATDNNATMIVDTNSVVRMTAGANNPFTVGNYGSGNTLIVTNGGVVYAGATNYPGFWMGNQAASSSNLTMVIGTNSLMASTGRVLVGDDGSFNTMMILGGGTVSNANYVEVGRTGTASNNLLVVSDGGSLLTNSGSGFIIGESGTGNMAIFTNGARGATTSALMIGYGVGAHNNGVTIIGTGTVVNVVGEVQIAGGSTIRNGGPTNNTLMILDGGTLINANWITVGRFSNASDNLLLVSGEGSLLTNTANGIIVGNYGRNNTAIITNGARVVTAGRITLGYNSIGSNNSLYVGGVGTLLSAASHIQVGTNGSYNLMVVGNGGSVTCATVFAVGASSSASNNTAIITDTGTVVSIAGELRVGELGSGNTAMILTGATVNLSSWVQVGRGAGALDNFLLVSGEGAWLNNTASANGIIVGNSGASGVAIFTNSARVDAPRLAIGYTAAGTNNSVFVGGAGTLLKIGSGGIQVGTNGWLSTMWVGSGATVTNTGVLQIGSAGSTSNNTLTVSGANTRFDSAGEIWLGNTDTHHNVMQILNGAVVTNSSFFLIGRRVGADSNTLIVNNASLFNGRVIGVGGSGAGNVAIFTNGAKVVTPQFDISRSTDSSNNSAYISSAGTSVQVGGDVRIGAPFDSSFNLLDVGGNSILQAGSNVFVGGTTSNIGVGNQFVLSGGATGVIGGDLVISTNSMLRNLSSGTVVLAGHFDNLSTNFTQNDFSGRFIFNGGGARIQLIEISSAYTTDMVVTNFMAGRFQVGDPVTGSNAYVRLVDERANSAGIGSEILAVSNLVVATSGSTLDLTNHTIFALYAGNTGMIQQAVADGVGRLDIVNTFTNQGNLYAIGGGILQFSNAFVNGPNGTIGLIAGTFTNFVTSGALTNRGTIGGGGLISVEIGNEATGRIAATNAGGGGILTLGAGFTNSGTGPVNAGLLAALGAGAELRINQSFTNAGQIWMNDETAALRLIDSSSNLVNAAGAKIEGLGAVHAFVENNGVVSNEMGGTLTFSLAMVNNNGGVMGAYNAGSVLNFDSVVTNQVGGVLRAANGGRLLFNAGLTNHGTLSIGATVNPSTAIITGTLLMGSTGIITMAHTNDTLVVRGNFVNGSTDTNNFNMRYGTMVFGSTTATITNTFEVASTNKGVTFGGFNQNMALGTLNITNHIEFVNNINNGGGLGTNECLYVDVLHLFNGATLKLSQLTIYVGVEFIYEDGNGTKTLTGMAGDAITEFNKDSYGLANVFLDNGGQIVFVPEPSTGVLLGLGLAALAGWRRRRKIMQR